MERRPPGPYPTLVPVIQSSVLLFIRYQLANVFRFYSGNHRRFAEMAFAFLTLALKNMTFVSFVAFDLACTRHAKSFRRGPVGFNFRHCELLYA